ncbi:GTP-binding protein 8 [Ixodes scapularis]
MGPAVADRWLVAAACCWMNVFGSGMLRSTAVVFAGSLQSFHVTREQAAWPVTLAGFSYMFSGITAAYTTLTTTVINRHFTNYKTVASGISNAGFTIGGLAFPPIAQLFFDRYGLRGGWSTGATEILIHVFFMELVESANFSVCFGAASLMAGLSGLARPPIIGHFRDGLGSYRGLFWLLGTLSACNVVLCTSHLSLARTQYQSMAIANVAVLGASNVGKSSLLQAVFHKVPDVCVKVSKKPGHTKTLNFYGVGKKFGLVDMPGYGFRQPKEFSAFASEFLTSRTNLKRTFLVLDGHVGFRNFDQDAVEMFEQLKVPYGLVLTKIDKASDAVILKNLMFVQQLRDKFMSHLCFPQPFLVSSITMEGIGYFQAFLAYIAGQLQVKGA